MKKKTHIENYALPSGQSVRFRLDKRPGSEVYYVYFRGPDGRRLERSTQCGGIKGASPAAIEIIKRTYLPEVQDSISSGIVSWADAKIQLRKAMKADNLRPTTIDDYLKYLLDPLQRSFPQCKGPGEITSQMASDWKIRRSLMVNAESLRNDIIAIRSLYRKWLISQCKIVSANPFDSLTLPKVDSHDPKVLTSMEQTQFLNWLSNRWNGWRLPILFLEVKGLVGPRISELAGLPSANLIDGRIKFDGDKVKGRAEGHASLPRPLYVELCRIAGPTFVFERFADELRAIHKERTNTRHVAVAPFSPDRMVRWLQKQLEEYRESKGIVKGQPSYFKLHNFRGTAITKAQNSGVSLDDASIFFRCHPDTILKHYSARDKLKVADDVARKMQNEDSKEGGNGEQASDDPTAG